MSMSHVLDFLATVYFILYIDWMNHDITQQMNQNKPKTWYDSSTITLVVILVNMKRWKMLSEKVSLQRILIASFTLADSLCHNSMGVWNNWQKKLYTLTITLLKIHAVLLLFSFS